MKESDMDPRWFEATDHKIVQFDFDHKSTAIIPACLQGRFSTFVAHIPLQTCLQPTYEER